MFTYLFTPWGRALLEKLSGFNLVKKFSHFKEPKFRYLIHKCPPPVPILSQLDPVQIPILLTEGTVHINIILPSALGSPKWSLSLSFP